MVYIGNLMDPRQFGGLKGNSIVHYMIELINFILYNQDYDLPIASATKSFAGGGPQGTLLGLLFFLTLINLCWFEDPKTDVGEKNNPT